MKTHVASFGTLLLISIQVLIAESQQRIRFGRCPAVRKRDDCPDLVWDDCTCDLDCPGKTKCCRDGCKFACLEPDTVLPSIRTKADVVFIMDSSGSIGKADYKREKQFVKDLTAVFQVSPNATRVSTIIYSDFPKLIFDFDTYSDKQSINTAVDNLEFLGNRTRIDKALELAHRVFSRSRPSVPRIAFVLTDGKQTEDYDAKPLDIAVRPLHDLGVQVYVIGIGSYIERDELYLLARRRQDVFFVSSFEQLLRQTYRIVNQIDSIQDLIPTLDITADMLFLLDSSSAIPKSDYPKELEFLKKVVALFKISPQYVRAGIISYGSRAELSIPLGRHATNEAINRSIDSLLHIGGAERIEQALALANQTFSQSSRPLVPKIMLILTHGGQLTTGGDLGTPVQALLGQGVTIFVIAIGENVDYVGLGQIVPRNYMIVDKSHKALEPYLPFAASYVRVNSDFSTPLHKDAAVVFLVDSSENVESNDFKRQREFVISLAKAFKIPENGVRASVITYGKEARPSVQLKDSDNFDRFQDSTVKMHRIQGPRRMDKALRLAVRMFRDHFRPGPRAVVLFTSGPQDITEPADLDGPSKQLEQLGSRTYVVAIGPEVRYHEVVSLVNTSSDVIQIPSFLRLQYELHAIGRHISLTQGSRPRFIADVVYLMDSSSSVGITNYRWQKDFVKAIARGLNHGDQATRACLVIYSNVARLITTFNSHKTLTQFERAVDGAPYLRRTRRVDKALEYAANLLRRARKGVPKVTVLITSGPRASSNSLDVASKQLSDVGAKSFVVAIGNTLNIRELRAVVSKSDDIFRVSAFLLLPRITESFSKHIISSFDYVEPPYLDVDIIFLMDSSETVSVESYRKEKSFVKSMAKYFNVSPRKSRAALVTYGSSASVLYPFGNVKFNDSVDVARFINGVRRLDLALQEAYRLLSSARPSVPKPVVLLTSGNQASGSPSPEDASRLLRSRGGKSFVTMIGREPDEDEFVKLVERRTQVFKVPSFDGMESYAVPLAKRIEENLKGGDATPPDFIADVVFMLDSSSNVPLAEYKKEKDFVKSLARDLNVSPGNSNAALVAYGRMAVEVIGFDSKRPLSDFETAVDNAPYINGNRRMDRALNKTVQIMTKARPTATKIAVLITAGRQTSEFGSQTPGEAALPLLENGVYDYVVAIGREPYYSELLPVVQEQSHIFRMASYDDLRPRETLVAQMIMETSTAPKPITDIESEVIFIMDSSFDVTEEGYIRQKAFLKDMARYLNISSGRSRAAVITYGNNANLVAGYSALSTFDEAVERAPFVGGGRRTDLALEDAGRLLSEARPYKAKWVFLLTAGPHPTTPGVKPLAEASTPVRERSDKVYVVAIGNRVNIRELQDVVVDPKDVYSVLSHQSLKSQTKLIATTVVENHDDSYRVVKTFKADIVFLVDASSSVGILDFISEKKFVKSVAKSLNVAPKKSRAALITYGDRSSRSSSSDMHSSLSVFEPAVDNAPYIGGPRRMHFAVDSADALLRAARPSVYKVVVLLTGGKQSSPQDVPLLMQSFRTLRAKGTKLFVIAIGSDYEREELLSTLERREDLLIVASFDTLLQQAWSTSKEIANRTDPIVPRDFQADVLFILDSSADVSREDYKKEKDFVVSLVKYLQLSPTETRAALLTYGYTATLVADYDSYDRLSLFTNAAERASYIGGSRRIDKALDFASRLMPDTRKLLPKIVVLFTAGRQQLGYPFDIEAEKLQNQGATTYIVSIGDKPNINELRPIVKDDNDVIKVASFDDLQQRVLLFAQKLGKQPDPKLPDNFAGAGVLFIIDSSSDVDSFNYEKEKHLVKVFTNALNSARGNYRTALITYGNRARVVYDLDNDMSSAALRRAIDLAPSMGGGRRTDRALDEGVRLVRNSERSVPKIVLLITAGPQIKAVGVQPLSSYGRALRDIRANSFVLAIGKNVSEQELRPVVGDAEDLFTVKTFLGLTSVVGRLASYIVEKTLRTTVPDLDIVFVMDSSSEVTQNNFRDEKEAVKAMARSLNVPSGRSRASIITYGEISSVVVKFDNYRTFSALESAIDRAPSIGGRRRIDRALEYAGRLLSEARRSVRRIVILFTSGRADPSSRDLYTSAKRIFDEKAELFIFAIGRRPYVPELTAVVNKLKHVVNVSSFMTLKGQSEKLILLIQESPAPTPSVTTTATSTKTTTPGRTPTTTITVTTATPETTPYPTLVFKADIVFLLDSSLGVTKDNFKKEKQFISRLSQALNLSPQNSRVAIVLYAYYPRLAIQLGLLQTPETLATVLEGLTRSVGLRRMDRALQRASIAFDKKRPDVRKIVIMLTAGPQTGSGQPLIEAVKPLRTIGAETYVVAIGSQVNVPELRSVVNRNDDVFTVRSFDRLLSNVRVIAEYIINAPTPTTPTATVETPTTTTTTTTPARPPTTTELTTASTTTPARVTSTATTTPTTTAMPLPTTPARPMAFFGDIVFVVDSSYEVNAENYNKEKDFVKSLAFTLNLGPGKSRASVIIYSSVASRAIKFDDHSSLASFNHAVDNLQYLGSVRRMDLGLREAAAAMKEARPGYPKVVVLLTAGRQSLSEVSLDASVKPLKSLGAKIFVVAVGSEAYTQELLRVVSKTDDVRRVPNFHSLALQTRPIAKYIVDNIVSQGAGKDLTNVIFLLDSSYDITRSQFTKEKGFVKSVAQSFQLPLENSKMVAIPYGSFVAPSQSLNTYRSLDEFDRDVDTLQILGGSRRMDEALIAVKHLLERVKSPARNIIILLTSGRQASGYRGMRLSDSGKDVAALGATVYVVTIGSAPSVQELRSIVADSQNIYQVGTFDYLEREAQSIGKDVISGWVQPFNVSADIVLMLDSSASLDEEDYKNQKEFIKHLARLLNATSENSRIAVIVYSGSTILVEGFSGYKSLDEFDNSIDDIPLLGGPYRRMNLALKFAGQVFNSARKDVSKVAVLLTAGRQFPAGTSLAPSANQLRSFNAVVLVIAVGRQYSKQELSPVVAAAEDLFEVPSFDALASSAKVIGQAIDDKSVPEPEDVIADIVFLVDSSSSVMAIDFRLEKKFVKAMARALNVSPDKSKGAVVMYGSKQDIVLSLEDFTDINDFKLAVDGANYIDGPRRMDLALEAAATVMNRARENVPKIVVLLTAGRQSLASSPDVLSTSVKPLRDLGVHTFVVSIGSEPDKQQLDSVVENQVDIFEVPSFKALFPQMIPISKSVAERSKTLDVDADIVFVLDASSFVARENFIKEKQFVKSLAKFLNVSSDASRASVVLYGSYPNTEIRFEDYGTLNEFNTRVDQALLLGGLRRMDLALGEASNILAGGRQGVPLIAVLVTTGEETSTDDSIPLDDAIQPLEDMGAHTFVVAIVHDPENTSADVLSVASFNDLPSRVYDIARHIKNESAPPPLRDQYIVFLLDSSSTVRPDEFKQEKDFMKTMARDLNLGTADRTKAAVVNYGSFPFTSVNFDDYFTQREFESAVDRITPAKGSRRIDRALDEAADILRQIDPYSPKILVLLTSGRQAQESDVTPFDVAIQPLRDMGTQTYVIAIGSEPDNQELRPLLVKAEDIFRVLFPIMISEVPRIVQHIRKDQQRVLELEADILFVIDSSYEVTQDDYKNQKDFIRSLLRSLNVSSDGSRTAVITYGDQASIVSRFTVLQPIDNFDKMVDNASYVGGDRRMDNALKMVARVLSEEKAESPKFVIFLSGGRQASTGRSFNDTIEPIRRFGAKTFVIGIGKQPDFIVLRPLVAYPKDIVTVASFKDLQSQTKQVASHITERAVTLRQGNVVDVVFLVDSSDGVNPINFHKEKSFVKLLAKSLHVSPGKSRAAVIAYSTNSQLEISFDTYKDLPAFERLVDDMDYIGGTRRMDKALEEAALVLKGSRPAVHRVVVLLTSGRQPLDAQSLAQSAGKLHSLGAMVYVVSIANDLDAKYFEVLVEDSKYVSHVATFDVLNNALPKVVAHVEEGVTSREQVNADVVFLMDASTADSSKYFESQKSLIKSIMKNLATSSDNLRASLILYSSSAFVLSDLRSYTTPEGFEDVVDRATYLRGTRRIDKALAAAAPQLSQSRPSAAKIVILITTGRQAQVSGVTPLDRASQPLRDANANILVIGIGKKPSIRELNLITGNPQAVDIILSPDEVIVNVHVLSRQLRLAANEGKQPALLPKADLIFLLDSSDGVSETTFKQQKDFIKSIVGQFQIAPDKTRAAVVRYSSSASAVINFNTFGNLDELVAGIENIRFLSGGRRLDAALKEANKVRESARSDVPIFVIVLTTGRQAIMPVSTPLDRAAQPLLASNASLIVVGIGSQPSDKELRSMVERDRDVFRLLPSQLQAQVPLLVVYMASQAGTALKRNFKADVLFLVDSSQTISKEKHLKELDFVKALARMLDISPDKSRVSVVTFGSTPGPQSIRFEDYTNIESLLKGIDAVPYIGGQKRLDKALLFAARVLSKSRRDVNKLLVVVTDGKQPLARDLLGVAARPLHEMGVKVYVIGAGENVDMEELGKITSRPDNLFYSRTFDFIVRQIPAVYEHIVSAGPQHQLRYGLFVVDSSGFRSSNEFAAQIDFIKSIAKRLDVSPNGTRAGVILYGSQPQLSIGLDNYKTIPEFYALLDGLSRQGGGRQLHKALKLAGETLQRSPEAIPKFLAVFVEGQQYVSNGIELLREAVRSLRTLGVTVYVVGIGSKLSRHELESMVQNSEHIVTVSSYAEMLRHVGSLSDLIEFTITAPCKGALDVGFVVDASGSVGLDNFSRKKNFVKLVARRIADSSPESRLGLISFSDTPKLFVDFSDFQRMTIDQFQTIADELPFHGGRSRLDLALQAASQDLFTDRRSGVPRVLVLVSDGRQSKDPGHVPLSRAVKPLQGQRVKVLAVGFGDNVHTKDLEIVTGSIDYILSEKEFDDIDTLQKELVSKACKV